MTLPLSPLRPDFAGQATPAQPDTPSRTDEDMNLGQRFEQMLWVEMLSHAGLEKAFTQGGGEAAASFSRYIVEAIAEDLALSHPLGFADGITHSTENDSQVQMEPDQ